MKLCFLLFHPVHTPLRKIWNLLPQATDSDDPVPGHIPLHNLSDHSEMPVSVSRIPFSVFIRTAHIQIFQKCIRASAAFKTDLIVISTFCRSKFHVSAVVSFTAYRNCIMISCSHGTVTIFYFDVCTSVIFYLNNRIRRLDFKMYIYFFVSLKALPVSAVLPLCFPACPLQEYRPLLTTANIFQCITVRSFLHFDTATVQIKLRTVSAPGSVTIQ